MLLPVELLVFLVIWLSTRFLLRWWNASGIAKRRYPPCLPSIPLFGSLPFLRGFNNIAGFFMRKADQLGPIFTFRAGNTFVLILNSREVIEDALVRHSWAFSGKRPIYSEGIINPNTKGLLMMNATPEWKKYHQLSLSVLKQLGFGVKSKMESRILNEVEFFAEHVHKQNGEPFNPRQLVHLSIANIIMNILFGRKRENNIEMAELTYQLRRVLDSIDSDLEVAPILRFLPFHRNKLRQLVDSNKEIHKILRIETEKSLEDGAEDCFVRRYLERVGEDYDAEQLRFTLRDLLAAGTDTTTNALLWSLIALANNPDVQNRLRAEIDDVVPRGGLPSLNDQPKLPFLDATIWEILRWKTLVPLAFPHMTLSDTNVGDYFVPAETLVLINLYAVHMDPKVWKDPEIFRPDRFLNKDGQVISKESVIPFSVGRRSCLGEVLARAELFLFLAGLVQRFFILPPEGQSSVDAKSIEPVAIVLTSSEFNIRLVARDETARLP